MFSRATIVLLISGFFFGWIFHPRGASEADLQGRLISAPPYYVRTKLFDADFIAPLVKASRSGDFFYPLEIREQGEVSRSGARRDSKYAHDVNRAHVNFGSKVRVVASSVSHVSIQQGSAFTGQTLVHQFSFSEMAGNNGTNTIFEYYKQWHGALVIFALQRKDLLTQSLGHGFGERIDSRTVDAFVKAIEAAWEADYHGLKVVDADGQLLTKRA